MRVDLSSNVCFPRLTAASTRFGSAVQTKGLGLRFVSATKRLMATCRSMTDRNTPRLRRWRVSLAKKPSTALSQDAEVGEEADELLVAMVLHVAADDGAIEDVESCEQRGGAVTFVVVRHRPGAAWLHRQSRLGAFIDTYAKVACAKLYDRKTPITAAHQNQEPADQRRSSSRPICAFNCWGRGRPSPVRSSSSRARLFRNKGS